MSQQPRSQSQRAAEARYDAKRRGRAVVVLRMSDKQARWLEQRQLPGESRAKAVARLLGVDAL